MLDAKRVINGTFGTVHLDGQLLAESFKLQAKVEATREEVQMCGSLVSGQKLTKLNFSGTLGMYKVDSKLARMFANDLKAGIDHSCTIISKLDDPDAYGKECVAFSGCKFNDLTLADWEAATLGKIEAPFTYEDYEFIDMI